MFLGRVNVLLLFPYGLPQADPDWNTLTLTPNLSTLRDFPVAELLTIKSDLQHIPYSIILPEKTKSENFKS